jgi:hypothetical protein
MRPDPPNFRAVNGRGIASFDSAMEEMQLHSLLCILMTDDLKGYRHIDTNTQLLEQFPPQTFFQCFPRLAFPAWKLPKTSQEHTRLASRD